LSSALSYIVPLFRAKSSARGRPQPHSACTWFDYVGCSHLVKCCSGKTGCPMGRAWGDKRQVLASTAASLARTNAVPMIVVFETLVMRQFNAYTHYTSLGKVRKRGSVGERLIRRQLDLGVGPQSLLFLWGFLEAVQGRTVLRVLNCSSISHK
jgi:hypothetical protein